MSPGPARAGVNGYAANPPLRGWDRFLELHVECVGEADASSGYLINIKAIDDAVRESALPLVRRAVETGQEPGRLLREALGAISASLPAEVRRIELALSPYHSVSMESEATHRVALRLRFDFAASHRLHVPEWSEEENRRCFGKCNHRSGHGHNYQVEPCVEMPAAGGSVFDVRALEGVVQAEVIDRFDHKHLNLDTAEFADGTGMNPTVENIARVCFQLLERPIAGLGDRVRLRSVRVWETDRTSSEYPG